VGAVLARTVALLDAQPARAQQRRLGRIHQEGLAGRRLPAHDAEDTAVVAPGR